VRRLVTNNLNTAVKVFDETYTPLLEKELDLVDTVPLDGSADHVMRSRALLRTFYLDNYRAVHWFFSLVVEL
jgi:hypothetical protein